MDRQSAGEAGFSLAEVLVAVAMLGVIVLALFALLTSGVQRAYGGKKTTQAAMIAGEVMEEVNVYEPQALFDVAATSTAPAVLQWECTGNRDADTRPEAESGTAGAIARRNAWRNLLARADLPASSEWPARLTVTATPLPSPASFADASLVRVEVRLTWTEWGTRPREVRLQSVNLPVNP